MGQFFYLIIVGLVLFVFLSCTLLCVNVDTGKAKLHSIVGHLFFVCVAVLVEWVGMELAIFVSVTTDQSIASSLL